MATSYTYIGSDERYYPDLALSVKPGDTATFDAKPDESWATSTSQKAAAAAPDEKA